ncbi:MAG: molybdopterin molybdotransferase MoeA [Cytophagaceae bacterium]|nr:molybdopterin molybdotransferase MoeA [Gemmatimonadaceae bacterium]
MAEAAARITAGIVALPTERVSLLDAPGRVLAEDAVAAYTMPPWTNSAMDGYAVRAADIVGASAGTPVQLRVLETVAAGAFPTVAVGAGEATRIMTGAPVPEGSDTVVRVEDTDDGTEMVEVRDTRDAGKNLRPRGEDFVTGAVVVPAGTAIAPAQVGVLATLGMPAVTVHRRPVVAILGSGDELVDLDRFHEVLAGRKIVSSNSYTLSALVRAHGGIPRLLGNSPDDPDALRALLLQARGADLVVTSAGASVGAFDHTRAVLASLGATLDFWKVRMRPGAPIGFGTLHGTPWIALPGNPVSAMVTFELFVRPVIRRLLGHARLHRQPVAVVLEEPVTIAARLTHFLRAVVSVRDDGVLAARLTGPQGSGILTSMSRANALLIIPEEQSHTPAGTRVHAFLMNDEAQLSATFAL